MHHCIGGVLSTGSWFCICQSHADVQKSVIVLTQSARQGLLCRLGRRAGDRPQQARVLGLQAGSDQNALLPDVPSQNLPPDHNAAAAAPARCIGAADAELP